MPCMHVLVQTEAERRRREAGVKQSMEIQVRSCGWVCMYVCMVFGIISRTKARSATSGVATVPKLVRTDLLNPRPQFLALGPCSGPRRWSILPRLSSCCQGIHVRLFWRPNAVFDTFSMESQ